MLITSSHPSHILRSSPRSTFRLFARDCSVKSFRVRSSALEAGGRRILRLIFRGILRYSLAACSLSLCENAALKGSSLSGADPEEGEGIGSMIKIIKVEQVFISLLSNE